MPQPTLSGCDKISTSSKELSSTEPPSLSISPTQSQPTSNPPLPDGVTENGCPAYQSTNNSCLDFFFDVLPKSDWEDVESKITKAYTADPATALRLIFHLGSIKQGKADRVNFYVCLDWLRRHHPRTFFVNLPFIPQITSFKTLADLCVFCAVQQIHRNAKIDVLQQQKENTTSGNLNKRPGSSLHQASRAYRRHHIAAATESSQYQGDNEDDTIDEVFKAMMRWTSKEEKSTPPGEHFLSDDWRWGPPAEKSVVRARQAKQRKICKELRQKRKASANSARRSSPETAELKKARKAHQGFLKDLEKRKKNYKKAFRAMLRESFDDRPSSDSNDRDGEALTSLYLLRKQIAEIFARQLQHDVVLMAQKEEGGEEKRTKITKDEKSVDTDKQKVVDDAAVLELSEASLIQTEVSLAAKWAPTKGGFHDTFTELVDAICLALYYKDPNMKDTSSSSFPPPDCDIAEYLKTSRAFEKYRKEYLAPLRRHLDIPEIKLSLRDYSSVNYSRVPSRAMKHLKKAFIRHDKDVVDEDKKFENFMNRVKDGKAKVAAGALLPHEIVSPFLKNYRSRDSMTKDKENLEELVLEEQWKRLREDLQSTSSSSSLPCFMESAIAVADVSGSMAGLPMEVCISLALLCAQISSPPWGGSIITFDDTPAIITFDDIRETPLRSLVERISQLPWGGSTNLQSTFELLLERAKKFNIPPDRMVKNLFIFSDMQFNAITPSYHHSSNSSRRVQPSNALTQLQNARRMFAEAQYPIPHLTFWNLRGGGGKMTLTGETTSSSCSSANKPAVAFEDGVSLVSGFSQNLLKSFLSGSLDKWTPQSLMEQSIQHESFAKLRVID